MYRVRIILKFVMFSVCVFKHVYRLMTLTFFFTEVILDVSVASPFNAISNYLQMEITFKFCIVVVLLACSIQNDERTTFFNFCTYSVVYKKLSILESITICYWWILYNLLNIAWWSVMDHNLNLIYCKNIRI